MRKFLIFLLPTLLVIFSGCESARSTSAPTPTQIDYGAYPENYEQIVKAHFAKTLNEPDAAQYRFGKPFAGYTLAGPLLGGKVEDAGYFVEVWLKAKDRVGNYLPERHLGVLIKNGEALMELNESELAAVKRSP